MTNVVAAGVVPFAYDRDRDRYLVLLGRERSGVDRRRWGWFGTYVDAGETPVMAAARASFRETLGLLRVSDEVLQDTVSIDEPLYIDCDNRVTRTYFVEVPFVPSAPTAFQSLRRLGDDDDDAHVKKDDLMWLNLWEIPDVQTELRPAFLQTFRTAFPEVFSADSQQ